MGAGLGEGNEGVQCGRGANCLANMEVIQEVEYDSSDLAGLDINDDDQACGSSSSSSNCRRRVGSGYSTSEIVGIGGNLKLKLKEKVKVGAIVEEYEEERATCSGFLKREQEGANRSWCSWCERVIPGRKDGDGAVASKSCESVASSASAESAA